MCQTLARILVLLPMSLLPVVAACEQESAQAGMTVTLGSAAENRTGTRRPTPAAPSSSRSSSAGTLSRPANPPSVAGAAAPAAASTCDIEVGAACQANSDCCPGVRCVQEVCADDCSASADCMSGCCLQGVVCAAADECSAQAAPGATPNSGAPSPTSYLARGYAPHEPPECVRDEDCGVGCCRWIGVEYRACRTDTACTLNWITLAPAGLPRWNPSSAAVFTGNLEADIVRARVTEDFKSGRYWVHVLDNGSYWQGMGFEAVPLAGMDVIIVPAMIWFDMYVGDSTTAVPVRQLPVVLDTQIVDPDYRGVQSHGVHELNGGGHWKVFSEANGAMRRALLTTPNNLDYWLFTEGKEENHCDPVEVHDEGTVSSISANGFALSSGQQWAYVVDPLPPLPRVGDRMVVYLNALVDSAKPKEENPLIVTYWIAGKSDVGLPWVERVR